MAGEQDKKGGSPEKFSEQLKGAQRLASRLQRAVRLSQTTWRDMREVDLYISSHLISRTANALDTVDTLLNRSRSSQTREMLGQVYIDLMSLFGEFRSLEAQGYSSLIEPDGRINPVKLDQLIDLDGDLASNVVALENHVTGLNRNSRLSISSYDQIHSIMGIVVELLEERRRLVESNPS